MNVAFLCESPEDQAVYSILVEAILGHEIQIIHEPKLALRSGGWAAVLAALPVAVRHLHYHPGADGLVIIVDSDDTPSHSEAHEQAEGEHADCRVCQILATLREIEANLGAAGPLQLKIAIGLPVPAIEAWLLYGVDPHVGEAQWAQVLREQPSVGRFRRRELKERLYGPVRLVADSRLSKAVIAARRISQELPALRQWFPAGFGTLMRTLERW